MYQRTFTSNPIRSDRDNSGWLFFALLLIGVVLISRLFYLQIIKHETYKLSAITEQQKKFTIPAERGKISILDGDEKLPIVLNESKFLIFVDPVFIENSLDAAKLLQPILGGTLDEIEKKLSSSSRYVELIKKADTDTKNKIMDLNIKGVVSKEIRTRSYPQGSIAAQVLGFVNDNDEGQYGIEEWLNDDLKGQDGLLKAITDIRGVPLAGNTENIVQEPVPGKNVTLTIDSTIQRIVEDALSEGVKKTNATGASAVVMDINSGAVKAMANWPSYDPAKYSEVPDLNIFKNKTISDALEAGSIMKPLTIASAIEQGLINSSSTYYDAGFSEVEGAKITNALNVGAGEKSIYDVVQFSLNTGAVHLLKLMGGGEINQKAREIWYNYLYNNYRFGQLTGIEQAGETKGIIPNPSSGQGLNIQFANTSFGQGIAISPIQMAAAQASIFNGGTYFKPSLVYSMTNKEGIEVTTEPIILKNNVVSKNTSDQIVSLLEKYAISSKQAALRPGFRVGGKTGTAQIPDGKGGYRDDYYIGAYAGFIGAKEIEYVVIVTIDEPKVSGFAGSDAARPIYNAIAINMIDSIPFMGE